MKVFLPNRMYFVVLMFFLFYTSLFSEESIKLKAQEVLYDKENNLITAINSVEIEYKDIILKTEKLTYDLNNNLIYIDTQTHLNYRGDEIFLNKLVYDIKNESIKIVDFYGYYQPYYSFSKECVLEKDVYKLTNAKITHCNLKKPHYYFASRRVKIYPQDKLILYSPSLIIRGITVLWLPYYRVSLKPSKDQLLVEPGYESDKGIIAKVKYTRKLTDEKEFRVMVDAYSNVSVAVGTEYRYSSKSNNGVFYTYYADEYKTKKNRWSLMLNNNYKLPLNLSLKSNLEFINDKQVYYYYNKENWFLIKKDLNSSISLSWETQKASSRISYLRTDTYSDEQQKFVNSQVKYPFDFIVYPFNISKLKISESLNITPTLIEGTTYYKLEAQNNFSINLPLRIYWITFTPSFTFSTLYTKTYLDLYYSIYGVNFPLRFTMSRFGVVDVAYSYRIRSQDNSFNLLSSTQAYTNEIKTSVNLFQKRNYLRFSTSYNFLKRPTTYWYESFSNLATDVGFSINLFDLGIHTETDIILKSLKNLNISLGLNILTNRIYLSYARNFNQMDKHSIAIQVDLYSADNYQFKLRTTNLITKQKYELLNGRLEFYKDLHCWEAMLYCDARKSLEPFKQEYIYELGGNVGLKFKPYVGKGQKPSEIDKRYFPWRD